MGLRGFTADLGIALPLFTVANCVECLSSAELVRVDGLELPESEVVLKRRELIGMRDCESRRCGRLFTGVVGRMGLEDWSGEDGASYDEGSGMGIGVDDTGGRGNKPAKSLRVLRCILGGRFGIIFSILISSRVGVKPRYHADGDDGDTRRGWISSGNMGFGLCMLPSEPRRRRGPGMPYPTSPGLKLIGKTSPNSGLRWNGGPDGFKSVMDCEANVFRSGRMVHGLTGLLADLGGISLSSLLRPRRWCSLVTFPG